MQTKTDNEKPNALATTDEGNIGVCSIAHVAAPRDIISNSLLGFASLEILKLAGQRNLVEKAFVDIYNPWRHSIKNCP